MSGTIPLKELAAEMPVGPGTRIRLNFSIALAGDDENNDSFIENNFDREPVAFQFGDGSLLAGFENCLKGMQAGQSKVFILRAAEAFGEVNEENIHDIPLRHFEAGFELQRGLVVEFKNAEGFTQPGVVKSLHADRVTIDFNHPLAGRDIEFRVRIEEVSPQD